MSTRLRITPVVDGVTLPDFYFDHPNFSGGAFSMTIYAEDTGAETLVWDKYTQAAGAITKTAGTTAAPGASTNDSRNPQNYSP